MKFKVLPTPPQSNRQVQEYVRAVEKGSKNYFVVQNGKGWYVRKASNRTSNGQLYSTKNEAVHVAKIRAAKKDSEVLVFNNRGALVSK